MNNILILGGASDIGLSIGQKLALEYKDSNLILCGRNEAYLKTLSNDCAIKYKISCQIMKFDALDYQSHQKFYEGLDPKPDIVICSFGYLGDQNQAQKEWAESARIINSNFTGAVSILNVIANDFESRRRGVIVGISSIAGDRGRGSNYIYGSAKAGFTAYLSGLRNRLYRSGVHVITVKPGFVKTKMIRSMNTPAMLTTTPDKVGKTIVNAIKKRKNTVVVLKAWTIIMFIIKRIPENIFKKMNL